MPPQRVANVSTPAEGEILVITNCGELARLTSHGEIIQRAAFNTKLSNLTAPNQLSNGNVVLVEYISTANDKLACVDFQGNIVWETKLPGHSVSSVDVFEERIVVNMHQDKIYALDFNGNVVWDFSNPDKILPANGFHWYQVIPLKSDGIYITTGNYVFLLDKNGNEVARITGDCFSGLEFTGNGVMYLTRFQGSLAGNLYWKVAQFNPNLATQLDRPRSTTELVTIKNYRETKRQILPNEFMLEAGPGPQGELYGYVMNYDFKTPASANTVTVYRVDP